MLTHELRTRHNQQHLLQLAARYRGFSKKQLARALGREPATLNCASDNPKLDLVVRLAEVLDWSVGDIAEALVEEVEITPDGRADFASLDGMAREAHLRGEHTQLVAIGRRMRDAATTADERALAAHRESGGLDGLGRYQAQMAAIRRGLAESPIDPALRALLRVNLANTHYALWLLDEARAIARDLIEEIGSAPDLDRRRGAARAFAHYVLGHVSRRRMQVEPDAIERHARACADELARAIEQYETLFARFGAPAWLGIIETCRAGLLEARVELGELESGVAIARLDELIERDAPGGDATESLAWACVFACNIALRHQEGPDLQRTMKRFTGRGFELADRLDNWALRERLLTLEHRQHRALSGMAGVPVDRTLDEARLRAVVGAMGRFPAFRGIGWDILRDASVVPAA